MDTSNMAVAKGMAIANETKHLTDREKALIGLAITTTRGCIKCTGSRIKKALDAGIPRETVMAGIDLAAMVNAGVTLAFAMQGIEKEGLDQECQEGTCSAGTSTSTTMPQKVLVKK
jgi:alkylhydroperoxidase/carboxymuconolactone decarboxylase family protein YurZ